MRAIVAVCLVLILCQPVNACTMNEGPQTLLRKPVLGDDALLATGFGVQVHPLLNVRKMHTGIDWMASSGTPVIAAGTGRVIEAGHVGKYGLTIVLDHGHGWLTRYAHLQRVAVTVGSCAERGNQIGEVGSTGLTTGPRLHFEVIKDGTQLDPLTVSGAP